MNSIKQINREIPVSTAVDMILESLPNLIQENKINRAQVETWMRNLAGIDTEEVRQRKRVDRPFKLNALDACIYDTRWQEAAKKSLTICLEQERLTSEARIYNGIGSGSADTVSEYDVRNYLDPHGLFFDIQLDQSMVLQASIRLLRGALISQQ